MSPTIITALVIAVLLLLGGVVLPAVNKRQFDSLPFELKIRILMKEAKGNHYFKDIAFGNKGTLYYVKNKRKVCILSWVIKEGAKVCTKKTLFDCWNYPETIAFSDEERAQAREALQKYNAGQKLKMRLDDEFDK